MRVITISEKIEQSVLESYQEEREIVLLVEFAKNRGSNGRVGERALSQLLQREQANVLSLVRKRRLQYPNIPHEDMVSAGYEGLIRRISSYEPTLGKFSSWVYRGIQQGLDKLCRDHQRQYKVEQKSLSVGEIAEVEEEMIDVQQAEMALNYLETLSVGSQKIVKAVSQGYGFREISDYLGKKYDAVRMAYHRAIQKIKDYLLSLEEEVVREISLPYVHPWKRMMYRFVRKSRVVRRTLMSQERSNSSMELNQESMTVNVPQRTSVRRLSCRALSLFYVFGLTLFYLLHDTRMSLAACQGWLCGPKEEIVKNDMWKAGNAGADTIINGGFLILQMVALFLIAIPLLVAWVRGIRQEDYTPYILGSITVFVLLTVINFLGGWLFGV